MVAGWRSIGRWSTLPLTNGDGTDEVITIPGNEQPEHAVRPEDLGRLLMERANAGNVDGVVALYEPDAVLVAPSGTVRGSDAIRRIYEQLLQPGGPTFAGEVRPAICAGDLALTSTRFAGGVTTEVARRQLDGTWRWLIDEPNVLR